MYLIQPAFAPSRTRMRPHAHATFAQQPRISFSRVTASKCRRNSIAQWICHRPDVPRSHVRNARARISPFSSTGSTRRRLPYRRNALSSSLGRAGALFPSSVSLLDRKARFFASPGRVTTIRGEPACRARSQSRHNLLYGGSKDPNHDAAMRIGSEVPKSLSAPIVVGLHPTAAVGLTSLLQRQGGVAKYPPAACIEEVCFSGFKRIGSNFHRTVIRVHYRVTSGSSGSSFGVYRPRHAEPLPRRVGECK